MRGRINLIHTHDCSKYFGMFEIFWRRSSLSDDAEETSRKMLSWSTAATRSCAHEVDGHVSLRLIGTCMSFTVRPHQTRPNCFFRGFSQHSSVAVHARVWTPAGTGLSTPRDGAIIARPKLPGRQRRLTGHKYLRNKLSHRDVSSCKFFL